MKTFLKNSLVVESCRLSSVYFVYPLMEILNFSYKTEEVYLESW